METDAGSAGDDAGSNCGCKVGRVADRWGLDDIDAELADRWRGDGTERHSLRQLEAYVGRRVLDAAMRAAGDDPLPGEVDNVYRLLTDDDVSAGVRVETRRRLEYQDVDVAAVREDFVSHQSIHSHLTDCLAVSHGAEESVADRLSSARETVQALRSRLEAVAGGTLRSLRGNGALDLDGFEVFVDVTVVCEECGRSAGFEALLDDGGCDCRNEG